MSAAECRAGGASGKLQQGDDAAGLSGDAGARMVSHGIELRSLTEESRIVSHI